MMYGYYSWNPIGGIISFVFWILIIILIIAVIRAISANGNPRMGGMGGRRWNRPGMRGPWGGNSALDLLNERYAKGEINKEEYEAKKKDILS